MKLLNGQELAGYIKDRQAHQVRFLRQAKKIIPKLAIIVCNDNPAINKYVGLKQQYGEDIQVEVQIHTLKQAAVSNLMGKLNRDKSVQGIIVQLPLEDPAQTDKIVSTIVPTKDVDSLGAKAKFTSATPMAILWLLAGYNIDLKNKNVTIIGQGRLVGAPLKRLLNDCKIDPKIIDINTKGREEILQKSDVIITAVGKPGLLTSKMIPKNAVVIDAGTASEDGVIRGDLADDVYERDDLMLTPKIGGVGPLTVCALFDNLIQSASKGN
jgi:methylenetetrahydrofolate dehydrogenase (NADP+)/methenyltetrahydrofolate cyclohydrolase